MLCGSSVTAQTVPDAGEFLPGPPEETTVEYIKDYLQYAWGKTMRGTELGQQAQNDFNAKAPYYLEAFSKAMEVMAPRPPPISQTESPVFIST